ncbi:hypothetical protein F4X10_11995 [Candidatus Poribacteria bacterium]|nr:hypothetical protein [Candidatus Poribacteria bacterium]
MRFLMINLILVCLLLFGIGYLAFGDTENGTVLEPHVHAVDETSFEASQELLKTDRETIYLEHQGTVKNLFGESLCRTFHFLIK